MAFFRKKKISDFSKLSLDELRKRTRILVIDDDKNSFPFEIIKKEGYAVDYWPRVERLNALERGDYDIIILDIGGVAKDYTQEDGLGILEHLKEVNPSQIVVAFSGQSFDLSKNRFWRMADDSLSKPVDATKCKRTIDNLIENRMTLEHYWQAITQILKREGVSDRRLKSIEAKVVSALKRKDKEDMAKALDAACEKAELCARLAGIAAKMAALLPL